MDVNTRLDVAFHGAFTPKRLHGRSPATVRKYRGEISRLEQFVGRLPVVGDLVDETILALLDAMVAEGARVETREKVRQCYSALAKFFAGEGVLPEPLSIPRMGRLAATPAPAWTDDEFTRLMRVCDDSGYMHNGIPRGLFWQSLLMVCHDTGQPLARVLPAEFVSLNAEASTITLATGFGRKTAPRQIWPETAGVIESIRSPSRAAIWEWPRSASKFSMDLNAILDRAGLREANMRQSRLWTLREATTSNPEALAWM